MIKVLIGDILASHAETLVNTVNCVGVMGKGIAEQFKKKFPGMYADYAQLCEMGKVKPGVPFHFKDVLGTSLINFPTKDHWRSSSKVEDVINGLDVFRQKYKEWGITAVAFPPLGCGNGGLEWAVVGPIMYQKLSSLDIDVEIYAPFGTPKHQLSQEFLSKSIKFAGMLKGRQNQKLNPNWIAILEVLAQLETQQYSTPVGRVIFQKICYVMTELGLETGFKFSQGSYGPFSPDVREAINIFANANLISEQQLGKMNALTVGSEFQKAISKYDSDLKPLSSKIAKTVDLFSRIKSTRQAEEITTVLFAARQVKKEDPGKKITEQDLFDFIVNWKKDWRDEERLNAVASTIRNLEMLKWLSLEYSESLRVAEY